MWECICCVLNYPCMHVYRIILWHSESYICNDECSIQHTYIYIYIYIIYILHKCKHTTTKPNTTKLSFLIGTCSRLLSEPERLSPNEYSFLIAHASRCILTGSFGSETMHRTAATCNRIGRHICNVYIYIHFYITICMYIYILHTCFILKEYNTIEYKKDWFQVL